MKKMTIPVAQPSATQIVAPHQKKAFHGYTIEELRVQRALADVRREYVKEKLESNFTNLIANPLSREDESRSSLAWSIGGKLLNLFSYTDYIALGVNLFNGGRKLVGMFKHRKK